MGHLGQWPGLPAWDLSTLRAWRAHLVPTHLLTLHPEDRGSSCATWACGFPLSRWASSTLPGCASTRVICVEGAWLPACGPRARTPWPGQRTRPSVTIPLRCGGPEPSRHLGFLGWIQTLSSARRAKERTVPQGQPALLRAVGLHSCLETGEPWVSEKALSGFIDADLSWHTLSCQTSCPFMS